MSETVRCEVGVGPGKAWDRRKCGEPALWANPGGMPLCDAHARYAHGPRKGQVQVDVVRYIAPLMGDGPGVPR